MNSSFDLRNLLTVREQIRVMAGAAVQTDQTQARVLRDLLQETDAAIIKISEAQGATGMRIVRGTA